MEDKLVKFYHECLLPELVEYFNLELWSPKDIKL